MLKPFYMWAGGKSKLLKHYLPILPNIHDYDYYVEPFFGGGAMYGNIIEQFTGEAFIGDVNTELMGVLQAVRSDVESFIVEASEIATIVLAEEGKDARKAAYYVQRKLYWLNPTPGRLYALMRLGFNGIWQSNKEGKGLFATPAGLLNQTGVSKVVDEQHLRAWNAHLQHTHIHAGSYETFPVPQDGKALIYLDPPYRDSFTNYSTGFNDDNQVQLLEWSKAQVEVGHTVLLANRHVDGDPFFETRLPEATFHYFDVVYTAGRRKQVENGYEAKPAREFLAILNKH